MNNLIYSARMALRDIMEVNIFSQGNDKVYLTFFPDLVWEGTQRKRTEDVIQNIIDRLHDMGMDLAGGESAIPALLNSDPVEIVRKAA
ncbi:hypothetical protein [Thermomonospora catenispora]|uniref:hypothetical protein n=1 Tax=Thermomonospora catenispora TaxID=2493090 RepID=UPI0011225983|nr:hypothetical protein [Thermomonospora catenispora]TNY36166.1 hypothetical protein EIO00_14905 [Thermomonospora catenispora]